ncbi:MAG: choice-of-anchor D domain-containing protein [Acidobacteriaceae bacterium]|nr:choice-of-anchor D domain-containing protein [Acidobacteriaceae bacterium]
MKKLIACLCLLAAALSFHARAEAQSVNATQTLLTQGLLAANGKGSFKAAAFLPDSNLVLLINQGDGLRLAKTDARATTTITQVQSGATGDVGIAMAVDPSGNVYVVGTSSSAVLSGTGSVPFPARADTSTNSFLAKFDANLKLVFLTFLGSGRTSATGVAATADAVFVTGITYNATFPVTSAGIQQVPASGTSGNGFVERFSADGATLVYSTYLTGAGGDTSPAAIAADANDNTYIAGSTNASGYPTVSALEPAIFATPSGFLSKLTPAGDGFVFSTFVAGGGLTSLAIDAGTSTLLASGNITLGQFPVSVAPMPLVNTTYQVLLRLALDGQSVSSETVLAPANTSYASVGANGSAWIAGTLAVPLLPGSSSPLLSLGEGFAEHVISSGAVDQTLRVGGLQADNASYASLSTAPGAPAASASVVAIPFTLTTSIDASLVKTERFDVPLVAAPTAFLSSGMRDAVTVCTSGRCSGTAGLLAEASITASAAALSISADDIPNVTIRNLGTSAATGIAIAVSGFTNTTNCASTLEVGAQCSVALTGSGPGSLSVSAANAVTATATLAANTLTPDALALSSYEMDFGVVTSSTPVARTLTVTNLTASPVTFSSAADGTLTTTYTFTQTTTDCAYGGATGKYTLAANATCHITLMLTPSTTASNDGIVKRTWLVGARDVLLTGFAEAAALNISATTIDFGTQFSGASALRLPRYLFVSNNSEAPVTHTPVVLAAGTAFMLTDECPTTLAAHSLCRMTIGYESSSAPSKDSLTITVDGVSVLLTGTTLQPATVTGSTANPNLSVSPTAITFATAVAVTGISGTKQTVTLKNAGTGTMALAVSASTEFPFINNCPATLSGGGSCTLVVGFAPEAPGVRQGLLAITGGSGFAPVYVTLSGTATALLPTNNGNLNVGTTYVGEPVVAWYKVQQAYSSLTATVSGAGFGVVFANDTGTGHPTLAASAFVQSTTAACTSCWVGVQFATGTAGTASGLLSFTSTAGGSTYSVSLSAVALPVAGLILSPVEQEFGTVATGSSSAPVTFTVANLLQNNATASIQSVSVTGDFVLSATTANGANNCTGTLASTSACYLSVTFVPSAVGQQTGSLTVVTDIGTASATLTGYGSASAGVALNPAVLNFNDIPGSASTQQTVTLSNTGISAISVGTPTVSSTAFATTSSCNIVAPGSLCTLAVTFTPQSGPTSGTLVLPITTTTNGQSATTSYYVALNGNYAAVASGLTILPDTANFGAEAVDSLGLTRQFTVYNFSAKTMNVSLSTPRQFPLSTPSSCATLTAGASCVFSASFLPGVAGEATGSVYATGTPTDGAPTVQALTYLLGYGTGSGALQVTGSALVPNAALSFGQVSSGQSKQQTLTLTNTGASSLTIRRVTSLPPFAASTTCGAALAVNASCAVTLTYAPVYELSTAGTPLTQAGTLTVESDAKDSPYTLSLTGQAVPAVSSSPASGSVLASYSLSQSSLTFANTTVGNMSASQTVTLTNTGNAILHVLSLLAATDFSATTDCTTIASGASCSLTASFSPSTLSTATVRTGTLEIHSDASTALEFISLLATSTPSPLTLSPSALDFGTVNVGATNPLSVMVTNTAATPVTFTGVTASGDYTTARGTCPADGSTLAAGSNCTLTVTFAPTLAGTRTGTLDLATNATQLPLTVALTGVGAQAKLTATPAALQFGSIAVGASAQLSLTLLNSGNATVTGIATSLSGANAADFAVIVPCSVTQLAANQGCTLTLAYTPSSTGAEAASLVIVSSDPNSPITVPLTGTGVAAGSFSLTTSGGGNSASVAVQTGFPAVYGLTLTPLNGYAGQVALTCVPVTTAVYAGCSMSPTLVTLNGSNAQSVQVTITTVTSQASRMIAATGVLLAGLPLMLLRRRNRKLVGWAMACAIAALIFVSGCGGGSGSTGNNNLRYTPTGTYAYKVTASSTSGTTISSSVTLNLTVQ